MGIIDPESLREHYAALSDEALMALNRGELTEFARAFYDEEIERRGLTKDEAPPGVPSAPAGVVGPRLRHVRRAALAACVATVLGVAMPEWSLWNSAPQMFGMETNIWQLGAIVLAVVVSLLTATVPLFYFALYRDEGDLPISRDMRWVAMAAAVVIGVLGIAAISGWIASFRGDSVIDVTGRSWTFSDTSKALGEVANFAALSVLVALFRLGSDVSERGPAVSNLLRVTTKMAVIAGGIVAVGCVVGLAATPWVYSDIRGRSLEMGHSTDNWAFWRLAADRVRTVLAIICVFVAPFVVWQSSRTQSSFSRQTVAGTSL
jgi:hypothetical protein